MMRVTPAIGDALNYCARSAAICLSLGSSFSLLPKTPFSPAITHTAAEILLAESSQESIAINESGVRTRLGNRGVEKPDPAILVHEGKPSPIREAEL